MKRSKLLWIPAPFLAAALLWAGEPSVTPTPAMDLWKDHQGPVRQDPRIIGKAFTFQGRAGYRNGNLTSLKIWSVGDHRLLGVVTDGCIPDNLAAELRKDPAAEVGGLFTVYPFTTYQKGALQFVCIDSVKIAKAAGGRTTGKKRVLIYHTGYKGEGADEALDDEFHVIDMIQADAEKNHIQLKEDPKGDRCVYTLVNGGKTKDLDGMTDIELWRECQRFFGLK